MPLENTVADPASTPTAESPLNAQIELIRQRYEPRIKALQDAGAQLAQDAPRPETVEAVINVDFEVTWADQTLAFDFPSITLKDRRIAFDLPEVTMGLERIVFDLPAVRMVDRKIGQKPEIHGWTVRWTDIIISVPEPYMQRNEIKLDLPQIAMRRKEIVLGIPEVRMKRVTWVIGLPQFKVINVSAATDRVKQRGEALRIEGEAIAAQMTAEVQQAVAQFMGSLGAAGELQGTQNTFDAALHTVKSGIDDLSARGVDPIKVPTDNGNLNLRKTYEELVIARDAALGQLQAVAGQAAGEVSAGVRLLTE